MSARKKIMELIESGQTVQALQHALTMGDASDIQWILENGAELEDHREPLVAAVSRGKDPVARASVVIEKGATVHANALNAAARRVPEERALELVRFLLESYDADINDPDRFGWTPLTCAVASDNMLLTSYLLEHGATDAVVLGDPENTGNYAPGESIRDIAKRVDKFQLEEGVYGSRRSRSLWDDDSDACACLETPKPPHMVGSDLQLAPDLQLSRARQVEA